MKSVLDASFDDVVIYVAPTKALVNQMAAEIYGRFQNRSEQYANNKISQSFFGFFTGMFYSYILLSFVINFLADYRFKPLECQVLVTVPQCLEILLLSPFAEKWRKRIKYAIFDEIHLIGDQDSGIFRFLFLFFYTIFFTDGISVYYFDLFHSFF
jgi:superfamily II RNA helicase